MLGIPQARTTHCVRYRYRYSECRRCDDACPHQAVRLSEEGVRLDPVRCQGCALCAVACPTEALVPANLPRLELLKQAAGKPRFSFGCAPSGETADAVVPCLGALDAAMLAYLARQGTAVELHGSGHCDQCEHGAKGAAQLALNLEGCATLRKAAAADGWGAVTVVATAPPAGSGRGTPYQASRRQFFRRLAGKGAESPARLEDTPLKAVRAARPFATAQRELIQAIWPPETAPMAVLESHPALPVGDLELRPGCTLCEACARVCPTGALLVTESAVAWSLDFAFSRCVACAVCVEACQPDVLRLRETIAVTPRRGARPLLALAKRRCARCDRSFVTADAVDTCPVCKGDDRDFDSIFG